MEEYLLNSLHGTTTNQPHLEHPRSIFKSRKEEDRLNLFLRYNVVTLQLLQVILGHRSLLVVQLLV
jgi:hypothetical protein